MAEDTDWIDSDRWLSDAEWLALERCSLAWLRSGEPVPPPVELATLEPLVQRLLEFTLSCGREQRKYVPPPGGEYRLGLDGIDRLYEAELRWQEYLTRDCDRMLRPYQTHQARLLIAIHECDPAAPIEPQLRRAVRLHLRRALLRAAQEGAKLMLKRDARALDFDINQHATAGQTSRASDDKRADRAPFAEPEFAGLAPGQDADDAPPSAAADLSSIKRLSCSVTGLLGDDERKPFVLAAIDELDQRSRERADMAPPALLFLDEFRCRQLTRFSLNVALSLKLFVGRHHHTQQVVTLREACTALKRRASEVARDKVIPMPAALDSMNQPVLWEVLRDLGIEVATANTMTVRLKRTRERLLERVLALVHEARKGRAGTTAVTTATDRPKVGGDQT